MFFSSRRVSVGKAGAATEQRMLDPVLWPEAQVSWSFFKAQETALLLSAPRVLASGSRLASSFDPRHRTGWLCPFLVKQKNYKRNGGESRT
jgi:hypothetical protein